MIKRVEKEKAKMIAKDVLALAKEVEARKMAAGAKYTRINGTTLVLKNDSSKGSKPARNRKAQ